MGMAHVHAHAAVAPEHVVTHRGSWFARDPRRSLCRLESGQQTPS